MVNDCQYQKGLFFRFVITLTIFISIILFIKQLTKIENQRNKEIIKIFNSNERIVCRDSSKQRFISKNLGYRLNKYQTKFENDIELFNISLCRKED